MSEAQLKNHVNSQLIWDNRVDERNIQVEVTNKSVTLKGSVPTIRAEIAAVDDALNVVGVSTVTNNLDVTLHDDLQNQDDVLQSNIENKLSYNPDINEFHVEVEVENNWVTLEGSVDALWKRFLIEEEVKDVVGVLGVTNKVTVAIDLDIEEEIIAEDIINALDRDSRVQPDTINVEVNDAHVTLSGVVHNYSAKEAAFNAAIRTAGVEEIEDDIVVEYS